MIRNLAILTGLCLALAPLAAHAELAVHNARAFATAETQKNGAVFLEIENTGAEADRLVKADGDAAETIELHTNIMEGDTMQMRPVEAYDVPAGGTLALEPAGHHIMLMGLKTPLVAGTQFPLTLTFEKAGERAVMVDVVAPGEAQDPAPAH